MKERDLGPQEIAFRAGVRRGTVYAWLNGTQIRDTPLEKLSKFLKIPKEVLRYGTVAFDKDILTEILTMIEDHIDKYGYELSIRQKVNIAHTVYSEYLTTYKLPADLYVTNLVDAIADH